MPWPILPYASSILGLPEWQASLLLGAGPGIGAGCLLAGRLSGAKVEYGLLPLGRVASRPAPWPSPSSSPGSPG